MAIYFDRYEYFRDSNNGVELLPFITLTEKSTDLYITYTKGVSRLDRISNQYYQKPLYTWLIMLANPDYNLEFEIPDQTQLKIPFPLQDSLTDYNNKVQTYLTTYKSTT